MKVSMLSISNVVSKMVLAVVTAASVSACGVSAGPVTPSDDFFPKPPSAGQKPDAQKPAPELPNEIQLSEGLSYTLWSGFGVNQSSDTLRSGHVRINCTKLRDESLEMSCTASYVEDNYMGSVSGGDLFSLIPQVIKGDRDGKNFSGTLNVSCSRARYGTVVCLHKVR